MEEKYFDPSKISIRKIEKLTAKKFVEKWHYSHKFSLCNIAYGVFYKTDENSEFFDCKEEIFIGAIIYGGPVGRQAATSISSEIKIDEVIELVRLVILDGYGKNIESYCISKSLSLLKQDFPKLKAVISYADPEQKHSGIIYQASNFLFTGLNSETNLMPNFSISLVDYPYQWMHSRTVFSTYGSHNVDHLKKVIGHTFWRKKESGKLRYIYLLCGKIEKKKILKTFKMKILPYPKDGKYVEEIEEIKVDNPIENHFFGR